MLCHLLYVKNVVDDLNEFMGWTFERLNEDISKLLVFDGDSIKGNPVYALTSHYNWIAGLPKSTVKYLDPIIFTAVDKELYGDLDIFYDHFGLLLVGQKGRSDTMKILAVKTWTRDGTIKLHRAIDSYHAKMLVLPDSVLPISEPDLFYCCSDKSQLKAFVDTLTDINRKVLKNLNCSIDRSGELLPFKKAVQEMLENQKTLLSKILN